MALDLSKLEARWEGGTSAIARDLKLNFKKFATDSTLSPVEAAMVTLAIARSVGFLDLENWASESLHGRLGSTRRKFKRRPSQRR